MKLANCPLPSDALCNDELMNVFGEREMELAASRILKVVRDEGTWATAICEDDFEHEPGGYEVDGFLNLIEYKWLREGNKDRYHVTAAFVQRLKEKRPQYFS